jgi:hypothetical protein
MGLVASVCQPSMLRMLIWLEASSAQNNMAALSADGSTVWVLLRRLNSSCNRTIAFVVRALRHWLGGSRVKVKSRSPASCRLSGTAPCLSRHLRMKDLAARLDLLARRRVDHAVVIGGDLLRRSGACASRFRCLWTVQRWTGTPSQTAAIACTELKTVGVSVACYLPDSLMKELYPAAAAANRRALAFIGDANGAGCRGLGRAAWTRLALKLLPLCTSIPRSAVTLPAGLLPAWSWVVAPDGRSSPMT